VTLLAKMSVSPAKPLSDGATELAFKLNEVKTMRLTIGYSASKCLCRTSCTD
jgi:hypothetical protein